MATSRVVASTATEKSLHLPPSFLKKRHLDTDRRRERRDIRLSSPSSPAIFSCSESQMVRFSAHMVAFLRDHRSWPVWLEKEEKSKDDEMLKKKKGNAELSKSTKECILGRGHWKTWKCSL